MVHQVVHRVGHELRSRELPGNQECHDLVADVRCFEQRLTVAVVAEHDVKQVVTAARGAVPRDQLVEVVVQGGPVGRQCGCLAVGYRFDDRGGEAGRYGRQPVVVERFEPRAEPGKSDGVHR